MYTMKRTDKTHESIIISKAVSLVKACKLPPLQQKNTHRWPDRRKDFRKFRPIYRANIGKMILHAVQHWPILLGKTNNRNLKFQVYFVLVAYEDMSEIMTKSQDEEFFGIPREYVEEHLLRQPGWRTLVKALLQYYKQRLVTPGKRWQTQYGDIYSLTRLIGAVRCAQGMNVSVIGGHMQTVAEIIKRCIYSKSFWTHYMGMELYNTLTGYFNLGPLINFDNFLVFLGSKVTTLSKERPVRDKVCRNYMKLWSQNVRKIAAEEDNECIYWIDTFTDNAVVLFMRALDQSTVMYQSCDIALEFVKLLMMDLPPVNVKLNLYEGHFVDLLINDKPIKLATIDYEEIPVFPMRRFCRWTAPLLQFVCNEMGKFGIGGLNKYRQYLNLILLFFSNYPGVEFQLGDEAMTAYNLLTLLRSILRILLVQIRKYTADSEHYHWDLAQYRVSLNLIMCLRNKLIRRVPVPSRFILTAVDKAIMVDLDQLTLLIQGRFLEARICEIASASGEQPSVAISAMFDFDLGLY